MPMYEYICDCGLKRELYLRLSEMETIDVWCHCGNTMKRIISRVARPQVMDYYSEQADAHFTGPKQKARVLREKGLTEAGDLKLADIAHKQSEGLDITKKWKRH